MVSFDQAIRHVHLRKIRDRNLAIFRLPGIPRQQIADINNTAQTFLSLAIKHKTKPNTIQAIVRHFGISAETATNDLNSLLDDLFTPRTGEDIHKSRIEYFSNELMAWGQENIIPINGGMELTYRCNLRCQHCYVNLAAADPAQESELRTERILEIVDEVERAGCLWFLLTGGEPMLKKNFIQVYKAVFQAGMLPIIYTNGTQISAEALSVLQTMPPHMIEVSIYGSSEYHYHQVTGSFSAYSIVWGNIDRLISLGLNVTLKSVGTIHTIHDLPNLVNFAESRGVPFHYDALIVRRLDGGKTPWQTRLRPEVAANTSMESDNVESQRNDFLTNYGDHLQRDGCPAGLSSFIIDPYGKLKICSTARTGISLESTPFTEIWWNHIPAERERLMRRPDSCRECSDVDFCRVCPVSARLETVEESGFNDSRFVCDVGKLRGALEISD